jgi:hypothetical protein
LAGREDLVFALKKRDVFTEYNSATLSSPVHGISAAGRGEMSGSADREVRLHLNSNMIFDTLSYKIFNHISTNFFKNFHPI